MIVLFVAKHAAVMVLLLLTIAGAGTLTAGAREGLALRCALGLALWAHALFLLGTLGQLRAVPLIAVAAIAIAGGAWRAYRDRDDDRDRRPAWIVAALVVAPLFLLALFPPLAFDETLYHLPFVRAFARDGALGFLPTLRFPFFPVLHELLCVPVFLLAGDVATHLVALVETIVTAALLVEWARRHHPRASWLAAALFLGSPIVIALGAFLYVDAALTLFVTAGFYALDRRRFALAGLFLGTACGVKYLGGFFALAALVFVLASAPNRRRAAAVFIAACTAAALPMTAWIFFYTGDPLFPFLRSSAWDLEPSRTIALGDRALGTLRVLWDVTFARGRMNFQPPVTPLLLLAVLLVLAAALRDARARWLVALGAVYLAVFSFLPQDSRYLVPLLPLVSIVAAVVVANRWPRMTTWLAVLAIAPGIAYAGYRISLQGPLPPSTPTQRTAWLMQRVPEYRALTLAGTERVYVCGGEQLKDYAAGELLGDHLGPYSYDRILGGAASTSAIAARLRPIGVRYFLVAKRHCAPPRADGGMELVHDDALAQLWRVQR